MSVVDLIRLLIMDEWIYYFFTFLIEIFLRSVSKFDLVSPLSQSKSLILGFTTLLKIDPKV